MQSPWIFKHLVIWMESKHYPVESIQAFGNRWRRLRAHDSLPCPACFINGEEQNLIARSVRGEVEPVFCVHCKTEFDIPLPK